ncbi:hypothetical protein [Streptomyces oceani]|nr:hypothetical protein [Streptomyces oceani]
MAQQPSKLGSMAVRQAVRAAGGTDVRRQIDVPVRVATERNADEFS